MVSSGLGSLAITSDPERIESSIHSLTYPSRKAALNTVTNQYERAIDDVTFRVVDPSYTATDLNGHSGHSGHSCHHTVEEGAIVDVATAPAGEPTALYVDATGPLPW